MEVPRAASENGEQSERQAFNFDSLSVDEVKFVNSALCAYQNSHALGNESSVRDREIEDVGDRLLHMFSAAVVKAAAEDLDHGRAILSGLADSDEISDHETALDIAPKFALHDSALTEEVILKFAGRDLYGRDELAALAAREYEDTLPSDRAAEFERRRMQISDPDGYSS
jgi:hypothetical protein